jgi:hypothetical protein
MASITPRSGGFQARVRRVGSKTKDSSQDVPTEAEAIDWAPSIGRSVDSVSPSRSSPLESHQSVTLHEALQRYSLEVTQGKKGAVQELGRIERFQRHPPLRSAACVTPCGRLSSVPRRATPLETTVEARSL